ncbi:MAG: glycosyltransferase [Myxococcota bacterium]
MKIVDIAESYSEHGGGVRTYVRHKLTAAARHGHEMVIVAPGTEDREEAVDGGRIVWVRSLRSPFDSRYGLFTRAKAVHQVLDREKPDIVEGSSPLGGGFFASSWKGDAKKVFVFHTDVVAVWPQTFLGARFGFDRVDRWSAPLWRGVRKLASGYDATVVSGGWLANRLHEHGIDNARVVPFGIDKRGFSPRLRDDAMRQKFLAQCGVAPDADLLMVVSRLDPEKRIPTLLEAFKRASKQRRLGMIMFGRGSMERSLQRKIDRTPGVHLSGYLGDRKDMAVAMASADAFVHGSAAETYGLVVAEAVCAGIPVIVPDRGGAAALAGPGYAETYGTGDPASCAAAIHRLLQRDREQLRSATTAAARRIGTMDQHFDRLFDLYGELAGRPRTVVKPERSLRVAV